MTPVTVVMTFKTPLPCFIISDSPASIGALFAEGSSKWRLGWKLRRG
jgi:hypothetical protein